MKTTFITLACIILLASSALADKSKNFEKHIPTSASQRIEISGISGSSITFKSWDKNEVYVHLRVSISSSDDDYEEEYISSVDMRISESSSTIRLVFDEGNEDRSFSFFDIFKRFYVNKKISGEIYVPQSNPFSTDMRYGTLTLEDMKGELSLNGTSNTLKMRNCAQVKLVENNYGTTTIENCGGALDLTGTSSTVTITDFDGAMRVNADYSNVMISRVKNNVSVSDKSGKVKIDNVDGNVKVDADYSNIAVNTVKGFVDIKSASGTIKARIMDGIQVKANYSTVDISGVKGSGGKPIIIKGQSGSLSLEDAAGDLEIDNPYSTIGLLRVHGNVSITTQSGRIDADEVVGNWSSQTTYTTINVRGLTATTISMSNSSNPITMKLKAAPSTVDIRNRYGGVDLSMPGGFSGDVEMSAEYGTIESNLPIKIKSMSSSAYGAGKIGSGSGSITIDTKSANIQVMQY